MLELQHPAASAGPGAPTAACWQLLPAGADLALTEADVDAAAAEAAALVGLAGLGGEQRRPEEEGHDAEEPGDSDAATAEQPAGSSGGQVGAAAEAEPDAAALAAARAAANEAAFAALEAALNAPDFFQLDSPQQEQQPGVEAGGGADMELADVAPAGATAAARPETAAAGRALQAAAAETAPADAEAAAAADDATCRAAKQSSWPWSIPPEQQAAAAAAIDGLLGQAAAPPSQPAVGAGAGSPAAGAEPAAGPAEVAAAGRKRRRQQWGESSQALQRRREGSQQERSTLAEAAGSSVSAAWPLQLPHSFKAGLPRREQYLKQRNDMQRVAAASLQALLVSRPAGLRAVGCRAQCSLNGQTLVGIPGCAALCCPVLPCSYTARLRLLSSELAGGAWQKHGHW